LKFFDIFDVQEASYCFTGTASTMRKFIARQKETRKF
jgi:hypothetical protein